MSVSVTDVLTPIALDMNPDTEPDIPNAIICEECGTPFARTGRGRPPKRCSDCRGQRGSAARVPRSMGTSTDVKQAEAVLEGMYQMVTLGLMMLSPNGASAWDNGLDKLRASNAVSLSGDKALCASIAKMGKVSSKGMFISAHVMAVLPVALVVREDLAVRRSNRESEIVEETENVTRLPEPPKRSSNLDFFG